MNLIDTHLHLINRDRFAYTWADGIPPLANRNFDLAYAMGLSAGRVSAWLHMEAAVDDAYYQEETRWVHKLIRDEPRLLGQIASCRPEADDGFDAWLEESAELGVVGYRRVLHVVDDAVSQTDHFRQNVRKFGRIGKSFDLCFLGRQLHIAVDLARACGDVAMILDHCGVPDIANGSLEPWKAQINVLASLPNVSCKISGLTAYTGAYPDRRAAIQPYLDHVVEQFGASRLLWGSDWPVVNCGSGMRDWLEMTGTFLDLFSDEEASDIAFRTAARLYGLNME